MERTEAEKTIAQLREEIRKHDRLYYQDAAPIISDREYDRLYKVAQNEMDPVKRAELFVRMNEIVVESRVIIPIVARPTVAAVSNRLRAPISGWDNDVWLLKDWYREG